MILVVLSGQSPLGIDHVYVGAQHPDGVRVQLFNDGGTYTFRVEQTPGPMLAINVADTKVAALAVCIQTAG